MNKLAVVVLPLPGCGRGKAPADGLGAPLRGSVLNAPGIHGANFVVARATNISDNN